MFNQDLRNILCEKNRLHRKYCSLPNDYNKEKYRTCRNSLSALIKMTKCCYAASLQSKCKDSHQQWKSINKLIHPGEKRGTINTIQFKNEPITEPSKIANAFNEYFTSIGPNLAISMNSEPIIPNRCVFSINLLPTNPDEIYKTIKLLHNTVAGVDHVNAIVVK